MFHFSASNVFGVTVPRTINTLVPNTTLGDNIVNHHTKLTDLSQNTHVISVAFCLSVSVNMHSRLDVLPDTKHTASCIVSS